MYRLEVHDGQGRITNFVLEDDKTISIGRNPGNDIVLDDASVSRSHCLLYVSPVGIEIEDLGSTNGVEVRGERIAARTAVPLEDELTIGKLRCYLRELGAAGSPDETTMQPFAQRTPPGRRTA